MFGAEGCWVRQKHGNADKPHNHAENHETSPQPAVVHKKQAEVKTTTSSHAKKTLRATTTRPPPTTTPKSVTTPESVGVAAMLSEASAVKKKSEEGVVAAEFIKKQAAEVEAAKAKLAQEAHLQHEGAASMVASGKALTDKVKTNSQVAKVLKQTAETQKMSATQAHSQAMASVHNAEAMMKTSDDIAMVKSMAQSQKVTAQTAAKQASLQISKAEEMEGKAAAMQKDAKADSHAVSTINKNAATEAASSKQLKNESLVLHSSQAELSKQENDMKSKAKQDAASAKHIRKIAMANQEKVVHANSEIASAEKKLEEAKHEKARGLDDLEKAKDLNLTAHSQKSASHAVLEQVNETRKTAKTMLSMAKKLDGAESLEKLARGQLTAADASEESANANIKGAQEMTAKSIATQRVGEHRLAQANAKERAARKQKTVAEGVKKIIDSPMAVQRSRAGEISAMQQAGLEYIAAGKAAQSVRTQNAKTKEVVNKEISSLGHAKKQSESVQHTATSASKPFLDKIIKEDARAVEKMKDTVDSVDKFLADKHPMDKMLATGHAKLAAAHMRKKTMLKNAKKSRECVHLPGVHLKAGEKLGHSIGSHEQCVQLCQQKVACKEVVYSEKDGCNTFQTSTDEVDQNGYDDSYTSSYCDVVANKEKMMHMLHNAYKHKPAQVVSK